MRQHFIEVDESELGRPHLRKSNPVYAGVMPPSTSQPGVPLISLDIKKQDLYTFFQVAVATQLKKQTLFAQGQGGSYTPIGGTAFQLTELHTNLLVGASGGLANPQRFMAQGICRYVREDINPVDLLNWNCITLVSFHIGDNKKSYFDSQLMTIPQPSALQIQGTWDPVGTQPATFATTGWPVSHNYLELFTQGLLDPDTSQLIHDPGVTLDQGQYFDLSLDPTLGTGSFGAVWTTLAAASAGFGINAYFHLIGALGVSVQ
jgi:hypothetical protein